MVQKNEYAPGEFCWADLATTDAAGAKSFYCDLLGWTAEDMPAGGGSVYTMLHRNGHAVCALFEMNSRERLPWPVWASYVAVSNVADSAGEVGRLGGAVVEGPMDVLDAGRMAVVQDPTGAVFILWEPRRHRGAQLRNESSALCWNELLTPDVAAAREFYCRLFGWKVRETTGARGAPYVEFQNSNGLALCGMMEIQKSWGEMPPHWSVYFAVDDCEGAAGKVRRLGGTVALETTEIPGVGRFCIAQDPQGGSFSLIQPNEE